MRSTTGRGSVPDDMIVAAVRANYEAQREAMVLADRPALCDLLAEDFTLTHMTGYVQSKADWLAEIDTGGMQYRSVENVEVVVSFEGDSPVLTARTLTDATIWGSAGTWRLQLRIYFEEHNEGWIAARTLASSW